MTYLAATKKLLLKSENKILRDLSLIVGACLVSSCMTFAPPTTLSGRQPIRDFDTANQYAPTVAPQLSSLPSADDPSCAATFATLAKDYAGANRPDLMAIGDSLYNGVQSLRINWYLSEWSAPSLVALRLGLIKEKVAARTGGRSFYGPQYPSYGQDVSKTVNFGLNLEALPVGGLLGSAVGLGSLPSYQADALKYLLDEYTPPNGRAMVDNLAFSGASSIDIDDWTPQDHRLHAREIIALQKKHPLSVGYLGDAFTSANGAFVLNPTHNSCLDKMTPLGQVLFRQPVRLIINVGGNNGIFAVAFNGKTLDTDTCNATDIANRNGVRRCDGNIRHFLLDRLINGVRSAGMKLATSHIVYVYINGITEPARPANLLFTRENGTERISTDVFIPASLTSTQLREADEAADKANAALRKVVDDLNVVTHDGRNGPLFTFVDEDATLARLDYKGCLARGEVDCQIRRLKIDAGRMNDGAGAADVYLDNRPYDVGPVPPGRHYPEIKAGGLFSLDNMHLSSVGYELMARAVTDAMAVNGDPLMEGGKECKGKNEPGYMGSATPIGACRYLMTLPGHAFTDINRRKQVPLRVIDRRDVAKLRQLQEFVDVFAK